MSVDNAIGMMDGAYFTSKNEILSFLNQLLDLNLTKIEQTASGCVACQLIEYAFPKSIPMSKVNWAAKSSHEYVANYKLLQNAFKKNKIQKYIDVDKLIRGKFQDNLEFCQWLKAFFDQTGGINGAREGYDPVAVRAKGKGGKAVGKSVGVKKTSSARSVGTARTGVSSGASRRTTASSSVSSSTPTTGSRSPRRPTSTASSSSSATRRQKENTTNTTTSSSSSSARLPTNPRKASVTASAATKAKYEDEIRSLKSENTTLKAKYSTLEHSSAETELTLQTVESERDFYFEKLRGIELMLQVYKEKEEEEEGSGEVSKVMDSVFKVMYATMDDNVEVDESGNLLGDITLQSNVDSSLSISVVDRGAGGNNNNVSVAKAQDELVENEEEELLTDGIDNSALEDVAANQFSDESDDEELLTAGLDEDEPLAAKMKELVVESANGQLKDMSAIVDDDGFSSEDDLRSD